MATLKITEEDLFERLAAGHAAGITVVTPNRRLTQTLHNDFSAWQISRGLTTWETADILPIGALVERFWEEALYDERIPSPPLLLRPAQEVALWEEIVRGSRLASVLLSVPATATQARDAWRLCHAWRLHAGLKIEDSLLVNEDTRAYLDWASRYEGLLRERRHTDAACLPDVVGGLVAHDALRKPRILVLFGFDILTPQQRDLLDALSRQGVRLERCGAKQYAAAPQRLEFSSTEEEITAAARWSRARLEAGGRTQLRIGVVVPDLAQSRAQVRRIFASILEPAFNISLGASLSEYPLTRDALQLLALVGSGISFDEASRLIRSPFIADADSERAGRARFDAALRERAGVRLTLDRLLRFLEMSATPQAPSLTDRLSRLARWRALHINAARTAPEWAQALEQVLKTVGFPGERTLDSAEFQTLEKWRQLLTEFAALERVTGRMSYAQACARLKRMAMDTLFQPEAPNVPVQILGVLESAGLSFDGLWIMGLKDEAWPLPVRPNPFVPVRMQRAAGVPQATAETSLELDRAITAGWFAASREVLVSHARLEGDSEFAPSALTAHLPLAALPLRHYVTPSEAIFAARRIERCEDSHGLLLRTAPLSSGAASTLTGGTAVFRDQAACPFRAFARHRLFSAPLQTPRPGLDAAERGTLLHALLAAVWNVLRDKAALDAIDSAALDALLERSAADAIARVRYFRPDALDPRFAELEKRRLIGLARDWLAVERARGGFAVTAIEDKRPLSFGGVAVNAKLDRMDRLDSGEYVVIDYKTAESRVSAWLGRRPDEPQLPMYALGAVEPVTAVAFAQVKTGDLRFKGLAANEGLLPGVNPITKDRSALAKLYPGWEDLLAAWRDEMEWLGEGFAAGDARVDPKYGELTCRYCDQQALCRIAEKSSAAAGET